MDLGEIIYSIVLVLFVYMTFGIIRNYYKSKFDESGQRLDMQEEDKKEVID
jgi:hypothetical protein